MLACSNHLYGVPVMDEFASLSRKKNSFVVIFWRSLLHLFDPFVFFFFNECLTRLHFALHLFSENNTMHVGKIGLNSRRCALPLKVYILFVNAQTNLKIYLIFLYYFKFKFII